MALQANSITAQLSKLSIGISRTSIRLGSTQKTTQKPEKIEKKKQDPSKSKFLPGHGEKIWIFTHILNGMTVYSHDPVLKAMKALRQLPFNGKKLKPSKLRKDFWKPLAMIQFPVGYGHVGRSVYHRMRELKHLHSVSWDDSYFYDHTGRVLSKYERGMKLQNQRPNTVADMSAVLGGIGKSNKIWRPLEGAAEEAAPTAASETPEQNAAAEQVDAGELIVTGEGASKSDEETGRQLGLLKTTIFWTEIADANFAERWPPNVEHYAFHDAEQQEIRVVETPESLAARESGAPESSEVRTENITAPMAPGDVVAESELNKASQTHSQTRQ